MLSPLLSFPLTLGRAGTPGSPSCLTTGQQIVNGGPAEVASLLPFTYVRAESYQLACEVSLFPPFPPPCAAHTPATPVTRVSTTTPNAFYTPSSGSPNSTQASAKISNNLPQILLMKCLLDLRSYVKRLHLLREGGWQLLL